MNIAVITGASAGIGRELVYAVDKDARYDEIWVIARRKERLEELRDKCTNPIRPIALDLSDLSSIDAYQALLEQEQPEIKMLVNAAGCGVFGPFAAADRKKLLASAQLNSLALTGMCHASLPYMHAGSSIINMGSNSAWQPVPYQAEFQQHHQHGLKLRLAAGAVSGGVRREQELCPEPVARDRPRAAPAGHPCHVRLPRLDQDRVPAGRAP